MARRMDVSMTRPAKRKAREWTLMIHKTFSTPHPNEGFHYCELGIPCVPIRVREILPKLPRQRAKKKVGK